MASLAKMWKFYSWPQTGASIGEQRNFCIGNIKLPLYELLCLSLSFQWLIIIYQRQKENLHYVFLGIAQKITCQDESQFRLFSDTSNLPNSVNRWSLVYILFIKFHFWLVITWFSSKSVLIKFPFAPIVERRRFLSENHVIFASPSHWHGLPSGG